MVIVLNDLELTNMYATSLRLAQKEKIIEKLSRKYSIIMKEMQEIKTTGNKKDYPPLPVQQAPDGSRYFCGGVRENQEMWRDGGLDDERRRISHLAMESRRIIGLQTIYPEGVNRQFCMNGAKDEDEAKMFAVKEFLRCEMKIKDHVFNEMKIEKIFPPAKESWDKLYVQFSSSLSVNTIYRYAKYSGRDQYLVTYSR